MAAAAAIGTEAVALLPSVAVRVNSAICRQTPDGTVVLTWISTSKYHPYLGLVSRAT